MSGVLIAVAASVSGLVIGYWIGRATGYTAGCLDGRVELWRMIMESKTKGTDDGFAEQSHDHWQPGA